MIRFALLAGVAFGASLLAAKGQTGPAAAGWALGLANGLAGLAIDRRAVRMTGERAVLAGLAAHAMRAMGLLLVIVAVRLRAGSASDAFVAAAVAAYFVFLFGEIARLARLRV